MSDGDKTEAPTARRRSEARSRGQISKSQDLTAAVLLLVGLLTLDLFGENILSRLYMLTHYSLGGGGSLLMTSGQMVELGQAAMGELFVLLLPILLILLLASLIAVFLQVGFLFTTEPIKPSLEKISPLKGIKKIFSANTVMMMGINVVKAIIVTVVAYYSLINEVNRIVFSAGMAFSELLGMAIEIFFSLGLRIAMVLIVLGILDWFYQKYRHEKGLKMTKEEVKEEMRSMEGDPSMKRRRREVQLRLALQRIRRDVPQADVVVTNPTHYAVALKYDAESMTAPRVLAKGEGYVAQRIKEVALAAGVPVVERKPLARALYRLCEVGQEIPAHLYKAVAEVLAYVYELSKKRARLTREPSLSAT